MHHFLSDFDFNLGNVNIHNRKSKTGLYYTDVDIWGVYATNTNSLYCTPCDEVANLRPQD